MAFGKREVADVLDGRVEITEKVDGSQFGFGIVDGELKMRSKGAEIVGDPPALFKPSCDTVQTAYENGAIPEGVWFWGEAMCKPKHNTLQYERTPKGHIALFGAVEDDTFLDYSSIEFLADRMGMDVVPLIYDDDGSWVDADYLMSLLDRESFLGGAKIEGFVVKNYAKNWLLGGTVVPIMCAKYVSEAFKEAHGSTWKKENTGKGRWETFTEGLRCERRWEKAVERLAEAGSLTNSPKDIGLLVKSIQQDVGEEEKSTILEVLWQEFGRDAVRKSAQGFPEWYKERLLRQSMVE